jgi:hypothetical protein
MFYLKDLPVNIKNVTVIFSALSFLLGLYIYREKFENKIIYNFIHILMLITIVVIIFSKDFGYENFFVNFYDKVLKTILIMVN